MRMMKLTGGKSMAEECLLRLGIALESAGVDVLIATHTSDIRWMTGFSGVFDDEQAHCTLILRDKVQESVCLFTDKRYSEALRQMDTLKLWRILDEKKPRFTYMAETLAEQLAVGTRSATVPVVIGIESDLRLDWYRALIKALDELAAQNHPYELKELPNLILGLRAIKTAEEIELIKQAQAITDAAFTHILGFIKPGLTERDVATELDFFMRKAGADCSAFPTIVASGPNSAIPHAVPSGRMLKRGDIILMDFGARLNDYCSDMTRTVFLGKPDKQQRKMYAATLAAHQALQEAYGPDCETSGLQKAAEAVLTEHGFAGRLIHSVGHGVGIDIHELPTIGPATTDRLLIGHVVTIEPGVYIEGVGGVRIENFGCVTKDGFENFTGSTKELLVL